MFPICLHTELLFDPLMILLLIHFSLEWEEIKEIKESHSKKSYPWSQGQDCDPGDEIAIAAALYLSRGGDRGEI